MERPTWWSELAPWQKGLTGVVGLVQVGLLVAAQVGLHRRSAHEVDGSELLWRSAALVNVVGPVSYSAVGRR